MDRRRRTHTSTTFEPGSKSRPQTEARSWLLGDRLAGMIHQDPQEQELQAGQRHGPEPDIGLQPPDIQAQLAGLDDLVLQVAVRARVVVAQPDPDPREQLSELERLGQVVLGAQVEAVHLGDDVTQAGQDQDRLVGAVAPEPGQHLRPAHPRHDQVQDDQAPVSGQGLPEPVFPVAGPADHIAVGDQDPLDQAAHFRLIVNNENPRAGQAGRRVAL